MRHDKVLADVRDNARHNTLIIAKQEHAKRYEDTGEVPEIYWLASFNASFRQFFLQQRLANEALSPGPLRVVRSHNES